MTARLEGGYDPLAIERDRYAWWESLGAFRPEARPGGEPWCLVIPPPNVTGSLHLGHALEQVMMDSITRMRRMQGRRALYLPGVDHAGIATQNMVEAELRAEGLTRHDVGRAAFVERTWRWKERFHERIRDQVRRLGASCDWSRERFTMDPELSRAVRRVFVELHRQGLAYRAPRIINWCVRCRTALSDLEVKFESQSDPLYHVHYPRPGGAEGLVVATVRPETMFGDVAVAVNPGDPRYRELVGHEVLLPLVDRPIPVIADDYVDVEFGTGALKITPGHDPNDHEVGLRHGLPVPNILTPDGRLTGVPDRYLGLGVAEARTAAVAELQERGLVREVRDYVHNVGRCDRCGTVVEPLVSTQWFVRMEPLARRAAAAVERGETRFVPERWTRVYLDWLAGIRDWCVSRQLWWGHRIPAWYCGSCPDPIVSETDPDPAVCPRCGGALRQDEDVLDTWFSSGLWPFSTLGWPDETPDLRAFYPTSLLVTGYDIIFFWVARMMMMGLHFTGRVPFARVCIHGLVRDEKGRKMSKTKGNVIDPMELVERHGADPLRFGLASLTTQGQDFALTEDRFVSARHFLNKLWNAARFILMNTPEGFAPRDPAELDLGPVDRWILSRSDRVTSEVTGLFEDVELAPITRALYAFTWNELCDWYLELAKLDLQGDDPARRDATLSCLHAVLGDVLRLLHPVVPFATEAIWQALPGERGPIALAPWPRPRGIALEPGEAAAVDGLLDTVRTLRSLRADLGLNPSDKGQAVVRGEAADTAPLARFEPAIRRLANLDALELVGPGAPRVPRALYATHGRLELYLRIPSPELLEREVGRLRRDLEKARANRDKLDRKLQNPGFRAKAAADIVAKDEAALAETRDSIERLEARLGRLTAE